MSHFYEHKIIEDTSTSEFYFMAEDVKYDDDWDDDGNDPGELSLMDISVIGGPHKSYDDAFDNMCRECGNPGWGNGPSEASEGNLSLVAVKTLLENHGRPVRAKSLRRGQFMKAWNEAFENRNDTPTP